MRRGGEGPPAAEVVAERKSALGLVKLHRGDAEVEDDAVDQGFAGALRHGRKARKSVLHQDEPAGGRLHEIGGSRDRAAVAVDADDLAIRGGDNFAAVAASAEGGIDIDAAGADREEFHGAAAEHGNVTSQSASDSRFAAAARHHSRAPCGPSAVTREPSCFLSARTFSVASASSARKRPGSQT